MFNFVNIMKNIISIVHLLCVCLCKHIYISILMNIMTINLFVMIFYSYSLMYDLATIPNTQSQTFVLFNLNRKHYFLLSTERCDILYHY